MDWSALGKGLALGFAMAAPVGPIGLLTIRRSLSMSTLHGFVTGLGAATADTFYGAIAAFGLTFLSHLLLQHQDSARLIGAVLLTVVGVRMFLAQPRLENKSEKNPSLWAAYFSSLLLTVTNPLTILSFLAVFAALGLASSAENYFSASALVAGIFFGSALWWFLLSTFSGIFRQKVTNRGMVWINRGSGVLILGFAAVALWSLVQSRF